MLVWTKYQITQHRGKSVKLFSKLELEGQIAQYSVNKMSNYSAQWKDNVKLLITVEIKGQNTRYSGKSMSDYSVWWNRRSDYSVQ